MANKAGLNPLVIIGILFFIFGFVTWLSSVLIPYLQLACELNNFQSYLVAFAFYISYFLMGIPSGWLLKITGFKNSLSIGLLLVAIGSLLFMPAAMNRFYPLFLLGLFVQGAGLTILQTASNPYVAILGPKESAARRISFMGICNGIAGALAPIILGAVILNDADALKEKLNHLNPVQKNLELNALADKVIIPYLIITGLLVIMAILIRFSALPEIDEDELEADLDGDGRTAKTSILQFPHLILGVFILFLYTGVEVIAGNSIIGYGTFHGIPLSASKFFSSFTLISMLVGYLIGIVCIPRYFSQETALKTSAVLGIVFALAAIFTAGITSVVFIALLGLANSLMWPSIWPLAIAGLGKFTKTGSSLLVMAISGAALLPLLYGYLTDHFNPQQAYWMVIPCYIAIGYYAVSGHQIGKLKI
ncbi:MULTISPECIES: sugar MFS transporter [Pedobacter]|uniref:Glucose/galactose transporter n=1 Tax=Pedobacter heparinus (strain ATCC 13125 / DSM 2366 / CIP 104194 / JCM 7457 / NBRC 12017 / NCIMB 9290 / NRRL B-14731 / HIM 762-3) TaxID=485917 RepID=C6XSM8_PEDHD|nr:MULTISPECIES: sugar MFS transporter [Pedobacter]ACU05591.1 glucose/galactose transporter [Pedobacter heparinus DSM 2366]MBB5440317.1 glucose/galactose transporter [Pedobacter sp. AK017]